MKSFTPGNCFVLSSPYEVIKKYLNKIKSRGYHCKIIELPVGRGILSGDMISRLSVDGKDVIRISYRIMYPDIKGWPCHATYGDKRDVLISCSEELDKIMSEIVSELSEVEPLKFI